VTAIRAVSAAQGNFVMIANAAMQDTALSYQARGIIAYVLSLPPKETEHLTAALIEAGGTNGREAVRSALRELEERGYYRRNRTNDGHGKWAWDQVISDLPLPSDANAQVAPYDGNPLDGFPLDGFPLDKDFKDGVTKDDRSPLRGDPSSAPGGADPDAGAKPDLDAPGSREDVERICKHLADRVEQRYGKRPPVIKRWRTAARQMLDLDNLTEQQVHAAIDWCQDDEFWAPNVRSVNKLREKYIQLRAAALRQQQRTAAAGGYRPATTDARVQQGMALVAKYEQEGDDEVDPAVPRHAIAGQVVTQ
jgi:hypothetical protein